MDLLKKLLYSVQVEYNCERTVLLKASDEVY